jgi:hypothetical protein
MGASAAIAVGLGGAKGGRPMIRSIFSPPNGRR